MKTLLIIPALALNSSVAFAQLGQQAPKNQLIEDLKKKVVNMIKNEKAKSSHTQTHFFLGDSADPEALEQAVNYRLNEVSDLIQLRDHAALEDVLTFTSLAFKAWNPELRNVDLKTQFKKNIAYFGYVDGFVTPVMALMDLAYGTQLSQFGGLMNLALNEISPVIAVGLKNKFGIPTEFSNLNFQTLRNQGRAGMWNTLTKGLDPDFFEVHNSIEPTAVNIDPTVHNNLGMDHFLINTLRSKNSYIESYLKKIGHEDSSEKISAKKEMHNNMTGKGFNPVGVINSIFKKESAVPQDEPVSCHAKCYKEIVNIARDSIGEGAMLGGGIGFLAGPKGALIGSVAGGVVGAGTALYVGYSECKASIQCGGKGSQKEQTTARENEARAKEAEARAKEAQAIAEEAELRVKETAAKIKEVETRIATAKERSKEAELKLEQEKIKAQEAAEKVKDAEEKLKTAKDKKLAEEKLAQAKKEKEEAEKRQAKAKKELDEAKENEKKEKEEAEKQKTQAEYQADKQMIKDEDSAAKLTPEEMKDRSNKLNSTPTIPPEDGISRTELQKNFDLNTKKMDKEISRAPYEINIVYPVNPNAGD